MSDFHPISGIQCHLEAKNDEKMAKMADFNEIFMKKQLQVVIGPQKSIIFEYFEQKTVISADISRFEARIFDFFEKNDDFLLLLLAFTEKRAFSPSVSFFRRFLADFAEKVLHEADLDEGKVRALECDQGTVFECLLRF